MASKCEKIDSSDSESDADYVPPTNDAEPYSSLSEYDDSEDEGVDFSESIKEKTTKKDVPADEHEAEIESDDTSKLSLKKRMDFLWDTFVKDVDSSTPKKSISAACNDSTPTDIKNKIGKKVFLITGAPLPENKVFQLEDKPLPKIFLTKDPVTDDKDSGPSGSSPEKGDPEQVSVREAPCNMKKRGIMSVIGTIGNKNKKPSVLEKSAMDWNSFKKAEGLGSELEKYNKGKQGFIERQRFLERSDLRSFEMQKSIRLTGRKK